MASEHRLAGIAPPPAGSAIRAAIEGRAVAVFNVGGRLFAIDATCPHAGGPLDRGRIDGTTVTCPWHGSQFDVRSGAVVRGPAAHPVRPYRVRVDGGDLVLESDFTA